MTQCDLMSIKKKLFKTFYIFWGPGGLVCSAVMKLGLPNLEKTFYFLQLYCLTFSFTQLMHKNKIFC